jgi:hypothetical protein
MIMRKMFFCILVACGLALPAYSATPTPTINTSLDAILQKLSSSAPTNDVTQIEQAIHASPALLDQLNALASSGKLKSITVKPGEIAVVNNGASFGAGFDANGMVLSGAFLGKQSQMAYDVRIPNEILPNNTVFALGHLAYHLRDAQYVEEAAHRAANEDGFMTEVMRNEAGAFIQGWNDVVDAATIANGNKSLLPGQVGQLLINLRYRSAFISAMNAKSGQKLTFLKDGRIEASDQNLNVMATALRNSPMADVE